ncbi:hypothetical protein HYV64_01045 [Candidatus Shapirobacteria bacterium]|nr:hypothetical protein [Candidatus Shapirobacteria bacterium]
MKEKTLYQQLEESNLNVILPRSSEQIHSMETPRSLFDIAHEVSSRRESLMSGLMEADGSLDQFGKPVGRFTSSREIESATLELDNIEKTWREFYHDALEVDDIEVAKFVEETILQYYGFDPIKDSDEDSVNETNSEDEWIDKFANHCLATEIKVLQLIYWPIKLKEDGQITTEINASQARVKRGIGTGAEDLERNYLTARITGRVNDTEIGEIAERSRISTLLKEEGKVGVGVVTFGSDPYGNLRLSLIGAFSQELQKGRPLSQNSVISFQLDSPQAADLIINQLDIASKNKDDGTRNNSLVMLKLIKKLYPQEVYECMLEHLTSRIEILSIKDYRNVAYPTMKSTLPRK